MIGREHFSMSDLGIGANTPLNKLRFFLIALVCSLHKVILTTCRSQHKRRRHHNDCAKNESCHTSTRKFFGIMRKAIFCWK